MSSKPYATPLHIELGPSRSLVVYIMGVHIVVLGLLMITAITRHQWEWGAIILLLLGFSAWYMVTKDAVRSQSKAIKRLLWDSDDDWWLSNASTQRQGPWVLSGETFISTRLVILKLRPIKSQWWTRPEYVLIPRDGVSAEVFRKLRVRLKFHNPIFKF